MNYTIGVDLGSTTTKAVVLGENEVVMGRGITNSRSNYEVACQVAMGEALINTRFSLIRGRLDLDGIAASEAQSRVKMLERWFRAQQYRSQLTVLTRELGRFAGRLLTAGAGLKTAVARITEQMSAEVPGLFAEGTRRKSDFFRDLAGSRYMQLAETESKAAGVAFDQVVGLFDKAILDLAPVLKLMADRKVQKVFHAARQDLEIFFNLMGAVPQPLFDTQVAAMVCGFGEQVCVQPCSVWL